MADELTIKMGKKVDKEPDDPGKIGQGDVPAMIEKGRDVEGQDGFGWIWVFCPHCGAVNRIYDRRGYDIWRCWCCRRLFDIIIFA